MEPYRQVFLDGACLAWGHTLLKMTAGVGYTGAWSDEQFGEDRGARNDFFTRIGRAPYPEDAVFTRLTELGGGLQPDVCLSLMGA
jgi:hypothetical protein